MRIQQAYRQQIGAIPRHYVQQRARGQFIAHVVRRYLDQSHAGDAAGNTHFGAVDRAPSLDVLLAHRAFIASFPRLNLIIFR